MTKVLIIGLDGIDFESVKHFNLDPLQQEIYGKETAGDMPLITPSIWSTFFTSKENDGISDFKKSDDHGRAADHYDSIYDELEDLDSSEWHGGIGNRRDELNVEPWIEKYNFETVNFPVYDYTIKFDNIGDYQLYWGSKCLDGEITPKELIEKFSKESRDILKRTRNSVSDDNDLVLSYIHDTDYICHILYYHFKMRKAITTYWKIVGKQIDNIKKDIPDDVLILLLSDHGSSIGPGSVPKGNTGHSQYGFYSFNREIDVPDEVLITDFEEIIEEELND